MTIDERVIDRIFEEKEKDRQRLARLSLPAKIEILVKLQDQADKIDRMRGGPGRSVWKLR